MIETLPMLCSKVLPDVKRLGLLDTWRRERFTALDILEFEHEERSA